MSVSRLLVAGLVLYLSVASDCYASQSALAKSEEAVSASDVPDTIAWRIFFLKVATFERDDPAFCRGWLIKLVTSDDIWQRKVDSQIVETIIRISQEQVDLMERYRELSKKTRASLRASYEQYLEAAQDRLDEVQIGFSGGIAEEMLVFAECMRLKSALIKVFGSRGSVTWTRLVEHVRQGKTGVKALGMGEDQKRELKQVNAALPWDLSFKVFPDVR